MIKTKDKGSIKYKSMNLNVDEVELNIYELAYT